MTIRTPISTPVPTGGLPYDATQITFTALGTGAVARTVQDKERDAVNALDFANANNLQIVGDDVTDDNVGLQRFLNRGGKLTLGGGKTYRNLAANLTFVANTELWIERGTTLHLDTTRLTALNVNDVQIHNHGIIKSTSLNSTDALPTNWSLRGIVEFGGTIASPAQRVGIDGPGTIFGDFVGTPAGTIGTKDKGVLTANVSTAWVKGLNIYGITGEAIIHIGSGANNSQDIEICENRIHDCNHDAISLESTGGPASWRVHDNVGWNCYSGIEAPGGTVINNTMFSMIIAGYKFGGNTPSTAGGPVIYSGNIGISNGLPSGGANDFDMSGTPGVTDGTLYFTNNKSYNSGRHAFQFQYLTLLIANDNYATGFGQNTATGQGFNAFTVTTAVIDGNVLANEGPHPGPGFQVDDVSGGTVVNAIWGQNSVSGVTTPYGSGQSSKGMVLRNSIPVTVTGATATVGATDTDIIANRAGTVTLTLPAAANHPGRRLVIRTIQAQTVVSASSNVVPRAGGAAGTAILAATAGNWAELKSDAANWQIMAGS